MFIKIRKWKKIIKIKNKFNFLKKIFLYNILNIYIIKNIKWKYRLQIFFKNIFFKKLTFNLKNIPICIKTHKFKKLFKFVQLNRNILKKKIINNQLTNIKNFF